MRVQRRCRRRVCKVGGSVDQGQCSHSDNCLTIQGMPLGQKLNVKMTQSLILSILSQLPFQAPPPCQLALFLSHGYGTLMVKLFKMATGMLQRTPDEPLVAVEDDLRETMAVLRGDGMDNNYTRMQSFYYIEMRYNYWLPSMVSSHIHTLSPSPLQR